MAAILEPRRHPQRPPQRPALRLVTTDGRTVGAPVALDLGIRPAHIVGAAVALVLAVLLSVAIGSGALAGLAPAPTAAQPTTARPAAAAADAAATTVRARAGDSLWSIARRLQPTGDVRPLVDQLVSLNGTAPLQPGQAVVLPA